MAYEDFEVSVSAGQPVELYLLVMGSSTWRMSNSIDTINVAGDLYRGTTGLSRTHITTGQEAIDITLPSGHGFPSSFAMIAPGQLATLTIFRYHRAEPSDIQVRYKGVVRTVSFTKQGNSGRIHIIPLTATFDKMIPDRTYQAPCNNVLFDTDCKIVSSAYDFLGSPSLASLNTITVPGLTIAKGDGWSTGGYVAFGVLDFRLILGQSMDVLTLVLPFYDNVVGEVITVYAGCDHSIATCAAKFANAINFGGCPYVPTKNIFQTGI